MHLIYTLIDPKNNQVFYVGRTARSLHKRLQGHLQDGKNKKSSKGRKIASILARGELPLIVEIDRATTIKEAIEKEAEWIFYYKRTGKVQNKASARTGGKVNADKHTSTSVPVANRTKVHFHNLLPTCPSCGSIAVVKVENYSLCRRCGEKW